MDPLPGFSRAMLGGDCMYLALDQRGPLNLQCYEPKIRAFRDWPRAEVAREDKRP